MLKKIISLALTLILSFQCFPSMSAYSINGGNTEINKLASQIEYEIEEKREENTKYFKLKDEQVLKVEYSTPVHTKNKDGKWEDLYNKERKNTINFSKNSKLEKLVQIEREQYGIAWNFEDAISSPISEINENHKVYKNIYTDVDVDYSILKNKLKETIILNSKSSQKEFTVDYYLENLTPNQTDTKTIELLNKNQKCVYTISAPKMFDSAGKSCENLNFEIVSSEEEKLKVKIICDKSWLEEKERVYPIFVDPDYTDEAFEYNIAMGAKPRELMFNTNWRKKDTNKSIFLNLAGSDFPGMGVVKVQVFGKNSQGEENCTYGTECYFLEAGKKYELYNEVNEKGYSEVQLRFVCLPGNLIRGCWSPDYKEEAGTFTIGAWGSKSKSKRQNSSDEKFDLIIKPDRHCWASFRTKTTNSSIYLALEGLGEQVNVEIWGLGGGNFSENCNNRCQQYSLALGKKYELYNIVSERHHTAVRLRFKGEPGTEIKGRWSPDFNDAWEREHNPGWTLIDGSGNERIVGSSSGNSGGTAIRPITNPQALINVPQISQVGKFPTGCESVSAVMVLNFYGCGISVKEFIDKHLVKKRISDHPDPNSAFVGSPYDTHSYGCFAPCIAKAMNKVLKEAHAEVIRGKSLKDLSEEYIRNGTPVLIWVTMGMRKTRPTTTWTIGYTDENARYRKGEKFTWPGNEHCVVLIGFNDKDYFVNDPLQALGKVKGAYEKNLLEERFREQGSQAVVVKKEKISIPRLSDQNVLKLGARGEEVRYLQNMLISIGYKVGSAGADGIFGKATESAVRSLQRASGISVDGKIGPQTAARICKLVPHNLPAKGEPNSIGRQYGEDGNVERERIYGPDGNAEKDIDYGNHGGHPSPHEHDWEWKNGKPKRGKAKTLNDKNGQKSDQESDEGTGEESDEKTDENKTEFHLDPGLTKKLFAAGAAVGTGYVIYRGVRMLPSMLPPLWWTVPGNLVIP